MDEVTTPAPATPVDPLSDICGRVAGALRRRWGRGPVRTSAHWAGPNLLLVLLHDGHTEQEKALLAAGLAGQVIEGRRTLQGLLEEELKEIVSTVTGREVVTMLSATRVNPNLSAELFALGGDLDAPDPASREQARANARESRHQSRALRGEPEQARRMARQASERRPPPDWGDRN